MNRRIGLSVVVLALSYIFAPQARADETDHASKLTFNRPVELPGHTILPAGTYWFALADPTDLGGKFVQIFDESRTKILATLITIAVERQETAKDTKIVFAEPTRDGPIALLRWFYPSELSGREFVYDK